MTEIVRESSPAVVLIVTSDASGNALAQGSGFIVSADGKVITNYHVIEGANSAMVKMSSGAFFLVDGVLAESESDDLAVLKVSGSGLPLLRLGEAKSVSTGERVIAIGSPLGLEGTVTDGIVSAMREESEMKTPLIQTSAPISHGSSGGPLLDLSGRVVGILTFKFSSGENLNFAVAVSALKTLLATAHAPTPLGERKASVAGPRIGGVNKSEGVNPPAQAQQTEVQPHVARARQFYDAKRYADAEGEIRAALRLDPQNADLHVALGQTLFSEDDWDGAIAEEREALRLNPNVAYAHQLLGMALGKVGDWSIAIAEYREALRLDPKDEDAHRRLGEALSVKGDWNGVVEEEREAVRLNANDARAHYDLGVALERTGDRRGALQEFRAAYELEPDTYREEYETRLGAKR
jgi:Flp pilus assembly protein TadD